MIMIILVKTKINLIFIDILIKSFLETECTYMVLCNPQNNPEKYYWSDKWGN